MSDNQDDIKRGPDPDKTKDRAEKQDRTENSVKKEGSEEKKGTGSEKKSKSSVAAGAAKKAAGKSETGQKAIEAAEKAKRAAIAIKSGALWLLKAWKGLMVTLIPPWGPIIWAVVIVTILVGYIGYSTFLVTGRNDTTAVCNNENSMNNQIGTISMDSTEREIAEEIGGFLTSSNFSSLGGGSMSVEQAAGLIGNMVHESAGLRPYVREGNISDDELYTNDEVRSWRISTAGSVEGSNAAIGLAQWDGARAEALISFAEDRNTEWYEFDLQMEYLAAELNGDVAGGYEASLISDNNLLQSDSSSVNSYTVGFQDTFYRPAAASAQTDNRTAAAVEFMEYYSGGSYSGSHGVTICGSTSNLHATEVAEAAMQMAWAWEDSDNAKTGCSFNRGGGACGRGEAKPEYIEGKETAHSETGTDPLVSGELFASCDRFVATVLRFTGVDTEVPWGSAATQKSHYQSSSQWEQVSQGTHRQIEWSSLTPGDVVSADQHVAIYIGQVDGEEFVAHASIQSNYSNGGNGMTGYQGPVNTLGGMNYQVFSPTG